MHPHMQTITAKYDVDIYIHALSGISFFSSASVCELNDNEKKKQL